MSTFNNSDTDSDDNVDNPIESLSEVICIRSFYDQFIKPNKLLFTPEYQREFCWSINKQKTLLYTIFNNLIMPNIIIYKLCKSEIQDNTCLYECLDGQHRILTIKNYIENNNELLYYKKNKEKLYYNSITNKKSRSLNENERDNFNNFKLFITFIKSSDSKKPLNINIKCKIFNLLQNGEKVDTYNKIKNFDNDIIKCILKNKLLLYLHDNNFNNKIHNVNNNSKLFNMYFLIRIFIILDKKNLEVNFLDTNLKNSLEANNCTGNDMVRHNNNIDKLYKKVLTILNIILNLEYKVSIEFVYIITCIYTNYKKKVLIKVINNEYIIKKYSSYCQVYQSEIKIFSKIFQIYNNIVDLITE